MELLTISHITQLFGITTRTLRYYEHIGLLKTTLRAHIENLSQEIDALDSVRRAATALLARTQQAVPHFIPETAE